MSGKQKLMSAAAIAIVVIASAATAVYFKYFAAAGPDLAKMTPQQIGEYFRSKDFNSMPREQRRDLFRQMRQSMDDRVNTYFTLPPEKRIAYLDKAIDEMSEMMRQFRPDPNRFRDPNWPRDPNQWRQRMANRTPEQSRARRETRDPVQDSMRMAYFNALRARAQQRGIQMGPGPGSGGRRGPS
jgi:hypothetical protein